MTLDEYSCPVRDPETDEPGGSFYRDHGVHLAMDEIERLRGELNRVRLTAQEQRATLEFAAHIDAKALDEYAQTVHRLRAELAEALAENVRLAGEYQSAADEICAALGVEWTADNLYPAVAIEAIEQLR